MMTSIDRVTGLPATAYTPPEDVVLAPEPGAPTAPRGAREILIERYMERVRDELLAAGYVPPSEVAARERAAAEKALREAADALDKRAPEWEYAGGVARDAWLRAGETLRARADRLAAGEES